MRKGLGLTCAIKCKPTNLLTLVGFFSSRLEPPRIESTCSPLTKRCHLKPSQRKESPIKRFTLVLTLCLTLCFAFSPITTDAAQRRSEPCVRYSGIKHTSSHDRHYAGGRGSSHKGGRYRNVRTNNRYGHHK